MTVALIALGAAVGAPLRYLTDRAIQRRRDAVFPWGTLVVNVVASIVLGSVTAAAASGQLSAPVVALIGTGFAGALSTYSTYSYETLRLLEDGSWLYAVANLLISMVAGVAGASLGWVIGSAIR